MDEIKKSKLDVLFFMTTAGSEPVREWLKNLTKDEKKIIGTDIKTVQLGWPIGMPVVKHIGEGIWEIRSTLSSKIARILFFTHGKAIILVNGFIKKTQKIPKDEIELAKKRMKQFIDSI